MKNTLILFTALFLANAAQANPIDFNKAMKCIYIGSTEIKAYLNLSIGPEVEQPSAQKRQADNNLEMRGLRINDDGAGTCNPASENQIACKGKYWSLKIDVSTLMAANLPGHAQPFYYYKAQYKQTRMGIPTASADLYCIEAGSNYFSRQ